MERAEQPLTLEDKAEPAEGRKQPRYTDFLWLP